MKRKRLVVIGLLGVALDGGKESERWERWRPTVALCQHEDLLVDRLELLYQRKSKALAQVITQDIEAISPETTVKGHEVEFDDPWDFESVYAALHDFGRGYQFDPEQEDYLVHITTGTHVAQICLFLLTESRRLPARLLQTSPPKRRTDGGPGDYEIIDLDLSKYDRIASRFAREQREAVSHLKGGIATRNARFNELIARIEQVALASREPLLLMGPTGAGKSQLARRIYELRRARRAISGGFVEINCATIRGDAAMSALFGHVKGAFTGALQARAGLLKAADGGALFLDEIGELGLDEQAMLLRALEEKSFFPLGGDREVRSDFQLIAGTNRDLGLEVARGRFREDLFARINLWTFRLPSLAERREDIEPNIDYELDAYARRTGAHVAFNREARARFLSFAVSPAARWLANFRDLNAAVVRMSTLAPGGRISVEIVDEEIARLVASWRPPESETQNDLLTELLGREAVAEIDLFDRLQLEQVLRVCREAHTLSEAGRQLFQISRQRKTTGNDADRLRKYLARFGISWEQVQEIEAS